MDDNIFADFNPKIPSEQQERHDPTSISEDVIDPTLAHAGVYHPPLNLSLGGTGIGVGVGQGSRNAGFVQEQEVEEEEEEVTLEGIGSVLQDLRNGVDIRPEAQDQQEDPEQAREGSGSLVSDREPVTTATATSADANGNGSASASASRPHSGLSLLTEIQRKQRAREQNRRAAERSRAKKRGETNALENTVISLQGENDKLRTRLASLQALKAGSAASPHSASASGPGIERSGHEDPNSTAGPDEGDTSSPAAAAAAAATAAPGLGPGIDYNYISKIHTTLTTAKRTLLEREIELQALRGTTSTPEIDALRQVVLQNSTSLKILQDETKGLSGMVDALRVEREGLVKYKEAVKRELQGKSDPSLGPGPEQEQGESSGGGGLEAEEDTVQSAAAAAAAATAVEEDRIEDHGDLGTDRGLEDVRGWVDQAIKDWDDTGIMSPSREMVQ